VLPTALRLTGAWLAAGLALFLLGLVLSASTLRASRRVSLEPNWHAGGGEVGLRRLYAAVLALCCAYYYVSIPFALAAVLLGGGGLVYLCFAIGHVNYGSPTMGGGVFVIGWILGRAFQRGDDLAVSFEVAEEMGEPTKRRSFLVRSRCQGLRVAVARDFQFVQRFHATAPLRG